MKKMWVFLVVMLLLVVTACGDNGQIMDGDGMLQIFECL